MSKVEETKELLAIAQIQAKIDDIEKRPSFWDRLNLGVQNTIIAIGGRTFMLTIFVAISVAVLTLSFYAASYFLGTKQISYIPLAIGCASEVLTLLFWINRKSRLTELTGPGDVGASFGEVKRLTNNAQQPIKRIKSPTLAGVLLSEGKSIAEDSESSLKESS